MTRFLHAKDDQETTLGKNLGIDFIRTLHGWLLFIEHVTKLHDVSLLFLTRSTHLPALGE